MAKRPQVVDSMKHTSATRVNVPTDQSDPLMREEDKRPTTYRPNIRNKEGPLLAWDRAENLDSNEIATYPLYIHEKVHPENWIQHLRNTPTDPNTQTSPRDLFSDFNGLPPDAKYKWYEYEGNWQNRLIKGDSISVMASLSAKEGYGNGSKGVQMFFFDPPFGIKFDSNFQPRTDSRSVDDEIKTVPVEPEIIQPFRDTYVNGIHSYLDQIYRIATHARNILLDSGSFFMQIGDENVNRCALVLDEVFGFENRVSMIQFQKSGSSPEKLLANVGDFLLWYAKDKSTVKYFQVYDTLITESDLIDHFSSYAMVEDPDGSFRNLTKEERENPKIVKENGGRLFKRERLLSQGKAKTRKQSPFIGTIDHGVPLPMNSGVLTMKDWRNSPQKIG